MMLRRSLFTQLLLASALVACGGESGTQPEDPATAVASVSISAARMSLAVGGTLSLSAAAVNAAGTTLARKTINWVSSRPDVAIITSEGLVTGVTPGTTIITAASGGRSGQLSLNVQAPNKVVLTSEGGDFIGGGNVFTYTNANAVLEPTVTATLFQLNVSGSKTWDGRFAMPSGAQLATGTYTNATRWPFPASGPTMDWSGDGRGCNSVTGSFTIDSLTWAGGFGSSLLSLDLHFEQHCNGGIAALRGTVHWRADDPTMPPGPVTPIPTTLWQPPISAVPATGDYVYLASEAGDAIGQGTTTLWQTGIRVDGSGPAASITLSSPASNAYGTFAGMRSLANLKVGFYDNPTQNNFTNPLVPGLAWYADGRGCASSTAGWFAVDRVNYANGVLVGIALRFEQRCNGASAALHGAVRWGVLPG